MPGPWPARDGRQTSKWTSTKIGRSGVCVDGWMDGGCGSGCVINVGMDENLCVMIYMLIFAWLWLCTPCHSVDLFIHRLLFHSFPSYFSLYFDHDPCTVCYLIGYCMHPIEHLFHVWCRSQVRFHVTRTYQKDIKLIWSSSFFGIHLTDAQSAKWNRVLHSLSH